MFQSTLPLTDEILPRNTTSYLVLTSRSLKGVRVALLPAQAIRSAAILPRLTSLSRKVCRVIESQFICWLKFMVTLVLTGTFMASSAGSVDTTTGLFLGEAAAADPAIPPTTSSAASEIVLTMYLSIIVGLFADNIELISLFNCIRCSSRYFAAMCIDYSAWAVGHSA